MIEWSHKQIQINDDLFFAYLASRDLLCPHEKCFLWGHNKFLLVGQTGSLRNVAFTVLDLIELSSSSYVTSHPLYPYLVQLD